MLYDLASLLIIGGAVHPFNASVICIGFRIFRRRSTIIVLCFLNFLGAADEVLHALSDEHIESLVTQGEWHELEDNFHVPDDRINEDLLLLLNDCLMHALGHLIRLKSRENPSHRRLEAREQPSIDVVRVEVRHPYRAVHEL